MSMSPDNQFSGNTAVKGGGGALLVTNAALVQCVSGGTQHSLRHCIGGTSLRRRSLLQLGGGEDVDPMSSQRVDNLAQGGYGDEMATAATRMILRRASDPEYCTNSNSSEVAAPAPTSVSVIRVPPGGGVTVSLHLKDALGQCVSGDISDASMWLQVGRCDHCLHV
jgi:predicted outer membrane repeat protein